MGGLQFVLCSEVTNWVSKLILCSEVTNGRTTICPLFRGNKLGLTCPLFRGNKWEDYNLSVVQKQQMGGL